MASGERDLLAGFAELIEGVLGCTNKRACICIYIALAVIMGDIYLLLQLYHYFFPYRIIFLSIVKETPRPPCCCSGREVESPCR
jgi:hypothetical protein